MVFFSIINEPSFAIPSIYKVIGIFGLAIFTITLPFSSTFKLAFQAITP
tara:strand:- start:878 stop:1024 length:147 start_codon:yes stop_codon:yes gene_type:complete